MNLTNRNTMLLFERNLNYVFFKFKQGVQNLQKDQLILKSIEGKVIGNYKIDNGQTRVNTAALTSGMYILTFINQNRSFKLIKL